jgi:hypothetical protein
LVPLPPAMQKTMHVEKLFENTSQRIFYSVVARSGTEFHARVPRSGGACSVAVTFGRPVRRRPPARSLLASVLPSDRRASTSGGVICHFARVAGSRYESAGQIVIARTWMG